MFQGKLILARADLRGKLLRDALLDDLCHIPDPLSSQEDWERYTHADLADVTVPDLLLERDRVRLRLQLERGPAPWLLERLGAIDARMQEVQHGG